MQAREEVNVYQLDFKIPFQTHSDSQNTAHKTTTWRDTLYRINHRNQTLITVFFQLFPQLASYHVYVRSNGITTERLSLIILSEMILLSHVLSYDIVLFQSFTDDYLKLFIFSYFYCPVPAPMECEPHNCRSLALSVFCSYQ